MYKKDLQLLLTKDNFPNFFLLYGGDNFQIELYADFIKKKYLADESLKVYFEEYNFAQASDFLALGSLFSEKKLLELKLNKKPNTKELKALIELCQKNQDNFLILELYDENSKQNELEKIFAHNFARFFQISNPKEAIELLELKAKNLGIQCTQNALFTLFESFDENLYLAAAELNKFEGLELDEKKIKEYCYSLDTGSFEHFFEKLLKKEHLKTELEKILDHSNEIAFLNFLLHNFFRLFKIALYAKIHGRVDFKEILAYVPPPKVAQSLNFMAFSLKIEQYKEIFNLLLTTEYELKTNSKLSKKEFLICELLKLVRILKG
ncbi:DNA polymerase III subunit delta [Campylobacter cuniculorum]|uniref:DNA polymerase III, delta subunit n=2 Tax=Campylobacter cuniculorum TaxID=374106 RepID=A0A1W6BY86_9BACT|nr:DNA polymerase III subunit delta [Campylobacter cuniculorum]ARJ57069.1 DNA polymerase III, delta subunit [Campylobacter cuniculorum DSM 23162 = LMG 24588]QOR04514.1 hypothetical protein A0071_00760 [Campylobacter cuniculorum]